jgi:urease subunit beta
MIPGEVRVCPGAVELNTGRETRTLVVVNDGDRPVQIGSHLHFCDANPALSFDRDAAQGFRLAVPAGTSVRFEPGVSRSVELVALAGRREVPGIQVRTGERPASRYERTARQVVPFGTPGATVTDPGRAAGSRVRVSDEPAQPRERTGGRGEYPT